MKNKQKEKKSNKIQNYIYRQLIWADHLRDYFGNSLPKKKLDLSIDFTIEPHWMFMSLWYGILFSVLEALNKIKVKVPGVKEDINQMYEILRKYRNAVFHVQDKYQNKKQRKLILDDKSVEKINKIHKTVGLFLLETLKKKLVLSDNFK